MLSDLTHVLPFWMWVFIIVFFVVDALMVHLMFKESLPKAWFAPLFMSFGCGIAMVLDILGVLKI